MARKVRHAFHDILEAIDRIEEVTRSKILAEFEASWELRWLVQRGIEIISEASRAIPAELTLAQRFPGHGCVGSAMYFGTNIRACRIPSSGKS